MKKKNKQNKLYFFCPSCFLPAERLEEHTKGYWRSVYRPTSSGKTMRVTDKMIDGTIESVWLVHKDGRRCACYYSREEAIFVPFTESFVEFKKWVAESLDGYYIIEAMGRYGSIIDWWEGVEKEFGIE